MTLNKSLENLTEGFKMKHEWKGQQQGGDPADAGSYEWVCYCDNCGIEMDDDNEHSDCPPDEQER